ncbi:MAG: VOC family protein [Bacillota bacterium]
MSKYHTKDTTHVKSITLLVRDFKRALEFYVDILGLSIIQKERHIVILSANQVDPLITLIEDRNALPLDITLGLYHYALLLPNRIELAKMIKQLTSKSYPISGASDHGVSEALYLDDPDGNGIEIYCDKDESEWPRENGELSMFTKGMDIGSVMSELSSEDIFEKISPQTLIGHLHFHVDNLDQARVFYVDVLGFNPMYTYLDSALFISSSGYHHHLGVNTWNGHAPLNKEKQVGLKSYVLNVPSRDYLTLIRNLSQHHLNVLTDGEQKYIIDILGQKIYLYSK